MKISRFDKVSVILSLSLIGSAAIWIFHQLGGPYERVQKELRTPKVLFGDDLLTKLLLVNDDRLGEITCISLWPIPKRRAANVAVVGQTGAIFLNELHEQIGSVAFERERISAFGDAPGSTKRYGTIQLVGVVGDQACRFLVRNSFRRAELIDCLGRSVWTYGAGYSGNSGLVDMTAGDVDGDGRFEYVALNSQGQELICLNEELSPLWSKRNVLASQVELIDGLTNTNLAIVYGEQSQLVLLDSRGNVISKSETGHYIGIFSLVRWPTSSSRQHILSKDSEQIIVIAFDGTRVAEYPAPMSAQLLHCYGTMVKLRASEAPGLAAVCSDVSLQISVLYIYNSEGELIYQEVFDQVCASVAVVPGDQPGTENLLLGADGKVFQYTSRLTRESKSSHVSSLRDGT